MYILGINPTQVDAAAEFKPGQLGADHEGRAFIYAKASASGGWALNDACIIHAGADAEALTATNAAQGTGGSKRVGVAMATVAQNSFGWLAVYGSGIDVKTAVAAVWTRMIATSTAGEIDDAGTGASTVAILGIGLETAQTGSAGVKPATLNFPFVNTEPVS